MERRYRSSLLSRTCLLQVTLFALFGHLPSSHGLTCYCSDEPNNGFSVCYWDGLECSGDVCYVRRFLKNSVIYTKWGCLSHSDPQHHVDLICDGAFNGDTDHYTCCTDRNTCNQNIQIVLPIERATTTSASLGTTTVDRSSSGNGDGSQSSDPLSISSSSPTDAVTEEDTTPHSPSPTITRVLQPSSDGNVASSETAATSLPPVSRPTSTTSPDPTGLPQLKCYCSTCPSLEVTCGAGSSCYVHKDYNLGMVEAADVPDSLSWGCLNRSESAKKCHRQSEEYECCSHKDYCNIELEPRRDDSADCNSVSGGCKPSQLLDEDIIIMISVGVVAFIIVVLVLVAMVVLLLRIRLLHQRKSIEAKISGSNSSTNSVTTESESLPSPTSTTSSSAHHYLHISSLPENEPVFSDSLKCNGK